MTWEEIKAQFSPAEPPVINLATMVMGIRPGPVRTAVKDFADHLDIGGYWDSLQHDFARANSVFEAAATYLRVETKQIALTHSTSLGLAQILGGVTMRPGQEMLISANAHPATLETLDCRARRDGTPSRQQRLYRDSAAVSEDEIIQNLSYQIRPWTRVLVLEWVSSTDGVKLPIAEISSLVESANRSRSASERLIFVVDGVHAFGIEADDFAALGCDFLIAGCHKLLYGPRGTAVICGKLDSWQHVVPSVAKLSGLTLAPGSDHVPGGLKVWENFFALSATFAWHACIGKGKIASRLHELATRLKSGLRGISGVTVITPVQTALSAAVVCVQIDGWTPSQARKALYEAHGVMPSTSAWDFHRATTHLRFSVSLAVDECDIDRAVDAVTKIAKSRPAG